MPPRCSPQIARNAYPFMKHAPQQIKRTQLFDYAIADRLIVNFRRKSPKHTVPYDEYPGVIAVEVSRVGCVVDAVVAGRVHHIFEPAREAFDGFGVDPKLIDQVDPTYKKQHRGMKSDEDDWQPE